MKRDGKKQIHSEFDFKKRNMKIMIIVVFDETIRGEKLRNQKSNTINEIKKQCIRGRKLKNHHYHQHKTYGLNGVREKQSVFNVYK